MNNFTVLENLKLKSFRENDDDEVSIEGAIFLTYTIECKTILSALISMFVDDEKEGIIEKWKHLLDYGMGKDKKANLKKVFEELQKRVGFVCNDGYDKSIASPIYNYTKELTYYFKPNDEFSFHPKLFIVKFKRNNDVYFRFMIGSMNLVNSKNKELISIFDLQAYEDNTGDRVNCSVLNELLNLSDEYSSPNIQEGNITKLCEVIKNLKLDKLFFDKADLSRIVAFPTENNELKDELKNAERIVSPFLTKKKLDDIGDNVLYTMESELKKHGYVRDGGTTEGKKVYVYKVNEGEKAFTHIKAYITEKEMYIGSLNFTERAFEKNKELLLRVDRDEEFVKYLESHYELHTFYYSKDYESTPEINDKLRDIARKLSSCLTQTISQIDGKWICQLSVTKKDELEKCLKGCSEENIEIKIAPFRCKKMEQPLQNQLQWEINNKAKHDDNFIFIFYVDGKRKAQFNYHIQTQIDGYDSAIEIELCHLSEQLLNKHVSSKTITKESEQIEGGIIRKDTVKMVRKSLPTLEYLLEKKQDCLNVEEISNQIERIRYIKTTMDKKLTEEEQKYIGFGGSNKKVIENLLEQGELLLAEFTEI